LLLHSNRAREDLPLKKERKGTEGVGLTVATTSGLEQGVATRRAEEGASAKKEEA